MQPQVQPQVQSPMQPQAARSTQQTVPPIAPHLPIDPQPMIEHGTEPVSIILALGIFISILFGSVTGLVQVILILRQTHPSR